MLTDLSAPLPHDFSLDFQVDGFDVAEVRLTTPLALGSSSSATRSPSQGKGSIMVLLDNSTSLSHHGNRIDVSAHCNGTRRVCHHISVHSCEGCRPGTTSCEPCCWTRSALH